MSQRVTRKELEGLVERLAERTGVSLVLDHNSVYGGWKLERSHGRFGGVSHFGDSARVNAPTMAYALRMALAGIATAEHEHSWERRTESGRTDDVWLECRCGSWKELA